MMTIIIFILVLGILVLVHELGHFVAAKKAGCNVEEFGIGFPPRLFSVKKGETRYAINLLPLGGYVKIKGENGEETTDPRSFVNKSFRWKTLIVSAGVIMNVFLAYILITIGLIIGTPSVVNEDTNRSSFARVSDPKLYVVDVLDTSPAQEANILIGDQIVSVNDEVVSNAEDLSTALNTEADEFSLSIIREGETITTPIAVQELDELEKKGIGVALAETQTVSYPWYIAPFIGLGKTLELLWLILTAFVALVGQLLSTGTPPADVAGPVGIAVITGQVAKQGIAALLQFTALLSLNLAIINIIPFPALDGGRLALIVLERIRQKKINVRLEQVIHTAGFLLLMLLIVVITAKDIATYGGTIMEAIKGYFS